MATAGLPGVGRLKKVKYEISKYRRLSQLVVLVLLVLAPFLRIFGFDLNTNSFWLAGHHFWAAHLVIVSTLVTFAIYVIIAISIIMGRVFCGWVCPQNTVNEFMRLWEARLGRVGARLIATVISFLGGVVVQAYFFDYQHTLAVLRTGQTPVAPMALVVSMGIFFTVAMAFMQTAVCKLACPYGHLQSILTNKKTLRLELFQWSTDICASCGLCAETCHMGVDPRQPEQKHCVACGDCLSACQLVSDARKLPRVLNVTFGDPALTELKPLGVKGQNRANTAKSFVPRLLAPGIAAVLFLGVFGYSVVTRPLVAVGVVRDYGAAAGGASTYGLMRVNLINLSNQPETYHLTLEGVPADWTHWDQNDIALQPGQSVVVPLNIIPLSGERGAHPFTLRALGLHSGASDTTKAFVYVQ